MYACRSVSVACRPAEKRRRRGEIGSIRRSILVGHRRPNRPQGVNGCVYESNEYLFVRGHKRSENQSTRIRKKPKALEKLSSIATITKAPSPGASNIIDFDKQNYSRHFYIKYEFINLEASWKEMNIKEILNIYKEIMNIYKEIMNIL